MTEAFAIVLHSHLPYARGAGRWPHGEEWVHEAILGTYLPLLGLLHDLRDDGVGYRITMQPVGMNVVFVLPVAYSIDVGPPRDFACAISAWRAYTRSRPSA